MWGLEDPASRDQDVRVPRRGRLDERIRRTWFQVSQEDLDACPELEGMAVEISRITGDSLRHVRERLARFQALDEAGAPPQRDRLVRPGAEADAPTPRVRRP